MDEMDHLAEAKKTLAAAEMYPEDRVSTIGQALAVISIAHSLIAILERADGLVMAIDDALFGMDDLHSEIEQALTGQEDDTL